MKGRATFFWQFLRRNKTTGSVVPSSRRLCRALAKHVGADRNGQPIKVFEAGPGTGVTTREMLTRFQPGDRLVIYEANPRFVKFLHEQFATNPAFAPYSDQVRLVEGLAQDCDETDFDHVVCGIPFTNCDAESVRAILQTMFDRLKPGGTLSYFEYLWVRRFRQTAALPRTRARLRAVHAVIEEFEAKYGCGSDVVLFNMPPASACHMRKPDVVET